jgi:release factor glutamine methyltransferase
VVHAQEESWWLVEAATEHSRSDLLTGRVVIEAAARNRALELARRRAGGEPLQYVIGRAAFRYLDLTVGPGVFIPRPETELVAERAIELLRPHGTAVDVGTGSGAIALSIAVERPDAVVMATEASPRALAYARRNAARYGAAIELYLCDLLGGLPGHLRGAIDVCVSNPPYVPPAERRLLPVDVVAHEPSEALFSEGGGLTTTRRLAREARSWLRAGGRLVLEIGDRQGASVAAMLGSLGYREVAAGRDLSGRERIVEATR